ncbi:MAG: HDIG domain-containing metalloprotein [bacterium]
MMRWFWRRRSSIAADNGAGKAVRFSGLRAFFTEQSLRLLRGCIFLAMLGLLFLLARPSGSSYLRGLEEGSIPSRTIKAAFPFEYEDEDKTSTLQAEAAARVPPVYRVAPGVVQQTSSTYSALVLSLGELGQISQDGMLLRTWIADLEKNLNITLDNREYKNVVSATPVGTWSTLEKYRDSTTFWSALRTVILRRMDLDIVDDRLPIDESQSQAELAFDDGRKIGVSIIGPDGIESLRPSTEGLLTLEEFYASAAKTLREDLFKGDEEAALRELADDILRAVVREPTLLYAEEETESRRQKARSEVEPEMVEVPEGRLLVSEGEPVSPTQAVIVDAYRSLIRLSWVSELGLFILALVTTTVIIAYLRRYHRPLSRDPRQLAVVLLIFVLVLALARVGAYLAPLTPELENVGFVVPIGALGVLITLLASGRLAAFLAAMASVYAGLILGGDSLDLRFIVVGLWSGFAAILAVHGVRQRSDLYRAGFLVAIMSILAILALHLLRIQDFEQLLRDTEPLKWSLVWGAVNGGLVFMLSIATLPLFEDLLGVTTDIKLLELGQKTALLQRLEREAPGTYQHTMTVSTLSESAAEAIGANALLTRVGAYYHDIGKMVKPAYFAENQQTAADKARHAKLKPQMSVLVIKNHIKYGLELAREYKLPHIIQDFIPEHHGTTLIAYFYNQVLATASPESVREEDFRYPGPKPRSKETAILMLADSIEAVSRTLADPNEGQIRATVQKIINDRFFDGQFDECDLTLADLKRLVDSFSDSLIHMLHQRIKYPPRPAARRHGPTDSEVEEESPLPLTRKIGIS